MIKWFCDFPKCYCEADGEIYVVRKLTDWNFLLSLLPLYIFMILDCKHYCPKHAKMLTGGEE